MTNERGQSLIETALFFFVLAPLIGMTLGFTHWFQVREKLVLASWQGAVMYSSGCMAPSDVEARLRDFLTTGAPALDPGHIRIHMGRAPGLQAFYQQLDEVTVGYTATSPWHRLLNLSQDQEETCTIVHSPHYWDPLLEHMSIPGAPPVHGPAYPW